MRNELIANERYYVNRPHQQFRFSHLFADSLVANLLARDQSTCHEERSGATLLIMSISLRIPWDLHRQRLDIQMEPDLPPLPPLSPTISPPILSRAQRAHDPAPI